MKLARLLKMVLLACTFVFMSASEDVANAYNYSYGQQVALDRMNDLRARNGAGIIFLNIAEKNKSAASGVIEKLCIACKIL